MKTGVENGLKMSYILVKLSSGNHYVPEMYEALMVIPEYWAAYMYFKTQ